MFNPSCSLKTTNPDQILSDIIADSRTVIKMICTAMRDLLCSDIKGAALQNHSFCLCPDIDECASAGACQAERVCVNTIGSFRCDCPPGYRTAGLGRQCRGEWALIEAFPSFTRVKVQMPHWKYSSSVSADINECLEADFCFSGGECVNTAGSYTCVCSQGFTLSDNRTACLGESVKHGSEFHSKSAAVKRQRGS